ncbi:acetate--CoA ligase family protein [Streptacidiphilus neutrinimicus]|uniref:acetate--CoA ligase family protein n=1 Tax=Streptacidiphilus neutrinimicus TaxID=105420 RepID=UPI0005AA42B1|nr:acetate--CoA ligase family protein [Streptacidiphilus neutrinimicus]
MVTSHELARRAEALLADGTAVTIRPLRREDHDAVLDLHAHRMSPEHPPVGLDRIEDLHARLGRMATGLPQLAEADLNPIVCGPASVVCVDARVRRGPRHVPDPCLRRLPDAPGEPT